MSRYSAQVEASNEGFGGNQNRGRKSNRRSSKIENNTHREVKPKFQAERERSVYNIVPKTENQAIALEYLRNKQMVVLYGSAGTGKTFLASVHAANLYLKGDIDKIVICRPYVQVGKSIGALPGSILEKLYPLVQTIIEDIEKVLGPAEVEYMLKNGKLVVEALENVRSRSYSKSCVIVDESSNCDINTMKAMLTRLEEDSQVIFCGDFKHQKDIRERSGLEWAIDIVEKVKRDRPHSMTSDDINQAKTNIGIVEFTVDDVVRSGLTAFWVKAFDYYSD